MFYFCLRILPIAPRLKRALCRQSRLFTQLFSVPAGQDCLLLNFKRREQMLSHHLPGPLRVPSLYTVQHLNVCGHHALDEIAFR